MKSRWTNRRNHLATHGYAFVLLFFVLGGIVTARAASPSEASQAPSTRTRNLAAKGGLFFDGFEGAISQQWRFGINGDTDPLRQAGDAQAIARAGLVQIVDKPLRAGAHAVRFEVPRRLGSFRSELALSSVPMFSDYWYGFSIFIPKDWTNDPQDGDIVAQWHGAANQDKKQFKVEGDSKGRPPVSLSLHDDRWEITFNWSSAVVKTAQDWENFKTEREKKEIGKFQKGVWTDWVFHAHWSYKEDGLVEVWQNGKQVVNRKGPNCYNDPNGPYFKVGIYHPAWKDIKADTFNQQKLIIPRKVIYHDEVRVIPNGKYEDVAPRPPQGNADVPDQQKEQ